jgi:hypothetical protein
MKMRYNWIDFYGVSFISFSRSVYLMADMCSNFHFAFPLKRLTGIARRTVAGFPILVLTTLVIISMKDIAIRGICNQGSDL